MLRTILLAFVVLSAVVSVAPNAAATHVPICSGVPPDFTDVQWFENNPVCAVDCAWDTLTMAKIKYALNCLRYLTG